MTLVEKVNTGEIVTLPVANLKSGLKVRAERIDLDHVARLELVVQDCPPIEVSYPSMRVVDGAHRVTAATRRSIAGIRAILTHYDSEAEELEAAIRANTGHGLPLSLAERRSLASRFVTTTEFSDERIAKTCGLAGPTVADIRRSVQPQKTTRLDTSKRVGKDNKRRPASPATQRDRIDDEVAADPDASAREIARRTGASPTTVATRKARMAAVPDAPADAPPTVGDLVTLAPTVWKDEPACERTNATREFGRFMDHFTTWNRRPFFDHVGEQAAECPADLRREAESVARSMSAAWARFADDLTKHNLGVAR